MRRQLVDVVVSVGRARHFVAASAKAFVVSDAVNPPRRQSALPWAIAVSQGRSSRHVSASGNGTSPRRTTEGGSVSTGESGPLSTGVDKTPRRFQHQVTASGGTPW